MNWFKQLFGIGDKMETDIHGLPFVTNIVPMPKVKPCKADIDISEPVISFVECVRNNPKRFEVNEFTGDYFYYTNQILDPEDYKSYTLWDKVTKEGWSVQGSRYIGPILVYLSHTDRCYSNPSFLTTDERVYIIKEIKDIMEYRKVRKIKLDQIRKDRRIRDERNRLKEIYK